MFDANGVFVPVKNYESVIDTGDSLPIAVKKILYGPKETPIMREAIAALEKVGQIRQITDGCWLFKALLAPKLQLASLLAQHTLRLVEWRRHG